MSSVSAGSRRGRTPVEPASVGEQVGVAAGDGLGQRGLVPGAGLAHGLEHAGDGGAGEAGDLAVGGLGAAEPHVESGGADGHAGLDEAGEVYLADYSGAIYRLESK